MATNVDALREGDEAFGRGDVDRALAPRADNIGWQGPDSERVPGHGLEGQEAITVLRQTSGKAGSPGTEFKVPFVHFWRFEDGTPIRVQTLSDTALIADALGNA